MEGGSTQNLEEHDQTLWHFPQHMEESCKITSIDKRYIPQVIAVEIMPYP